jgi:hypothetical protein
VRETFLSLRQTRQFRSWIPIPAHSQSEQKNVPESFPNPAALRKAQQEAAEFRRLQKLDDELAGINEETCDLFPVQQQRGGWTMQEKRRLLQSHDRSVSTGVRRKSRIVKRRKLNMG